MNEHEVIEAINKLPLDLRVEVVVADILSSGYDATDLFVNPTGIFQRRFNKDILNAEITSFSKEGNVIELKNTPPAVVVNTIREGLYDMLPQVLFHNPPAKASKAFKSADNMIAEYKRRVLEEKDAREFFMIYEIEFYRQRIANAMHEKKLFEAISYSMDDNEILSYWKLPEIFDQRQKGILFYLFPVFHKIRGRLNYMEEVYHILLNQEIKIEKSEINRVLNYDNSSFTLGSIYLSADSVLGDHYSYYYPNIVVSVLQLPKESIVNYLPGGKNIRILNKLNEYFMPLHFETEIFVDVQKSQWALVSEQNKSRLGYSSSL